MSASVKISLDLPIDIQGTLFDDEFEVLQEAGEEAKQVAKDIWTGWKYGPNYPREQQGTSFGAWRYEAMQPGDGGFTNGIQVLNDAEIQPRGGSYEVKAWGKPTGKKKPYANNQVGEYYAAYVTRSGSSRPEWQVVFDQIVAKVLPDTERRLRDKIVGNLGRKRQTKSFKVDKSSQSIDFLEIL